MRSEVFADTGAWIASSVSRDALHTIAVTTYRDLLRQGRVLVTTNLVVAETYTAIYRAGGRAPALRFLDLLRASARVRKVYSDAALEDKAEEILVRYADQDFSFVDAVSFAIMRAHGIQEAFAFDHHFLTAGFTLVPGSR